MKLPHTTAAWGYVLAWMLVFSSEPQAQISVGPNVQVSQARPDVMHTEVLLATDPSDAKRLMACSMIGPTSAGKWMSGVYASFDGGTGWTPVVTQDKYFISGDPACMYGMNDMAYFASLNAGKDRTFARLEAYRSEDAGRTWTPSKIPRGISDHVDREFIAIDNARGQYSGRVYLYGQALGYSLDNTLPAGISLFRSLDRGATYERPIQRFPPDRTTVFHPGNAVVLSDGTFVALFMQSILDRRNDGYPDSNPVPASRPNGFVKVMTSSDGGETLDPAVQVSDLYEDWRPEASTVPSLAADIHGGVFRDRLYAVWADGRFNGRTQIVLAYSADKGKTWSKPHLVSDDRVPVRGGLEHGAAMPTVAVNKDGIVGVSWYDRRESPNDVDYYVRFAASLDGGETFVPSVRVSEKPRVFGQDERWPIKGLAFGGATGPSRLLIVRDERLNSGDTAGLAADANGVFHPLWIDNRTGVQQIWTAPVRVDGQATKNGDASLANLDDVTSKMEIEVMDSSYDRVKHEGILAVRLRNISKDTIVPPVKVRALGITSELGIASIVNADNAVTGDGAVWDFTALVEGGLLLPGRTSGVKPLVFRLADFGSFRQRNGYYKWIFVDVDAIVLGSVRDKQEGKTKANPSNFGDPATNLGSASGGQLTLSPSFGRSTTMLGKNLGTGGLTGGFSPLYQLGGSRSGQVSLRLGF